MDTALLKLKQLLSVRYGKGLELRRLVDLSKIKEDSTPVVQGNDLHIPIVTQGQFLGTAVIRHGWELSSDKKQSLTQLVRMVLEPQLYNEFLERREINLQSVDAFSFDIENLSLFEEPSEFPPNLHDFPAESPQQLITSLLHLQGHDNSLIKKVALQIHEFSARWAFVPLEDVAGELNSSLDISNLGGMTLFVENVENLSPKIQILLADYLKSPRSLAEPLILTSSTLSLADLSHRLNCRELDLDIQESNLEIERAPLNSQMLRELLDLFFHKDENQDLH